jgi:hypothetical protein
MTNNSTDTFFGIIRHSVSSWGDLFRAIVFVTAVLSMLSAFIWLLLSQLGPRGLEIRTSTGTSIVFGGPGEVIRFDNILVHPRGWIDTGLNLNTGDEVAFSASGSVNIAMGRMLTALNNMSIAKKRNEKIGKTRSVTAFSKKQEMAALFPYPWAGPEGLSDEDFRSDSAKRSSRATRKERIIPPARLGQLIAIVSPTHICPDKGRPSGNSQVIPYDKNEKSTSFRSSAPGRLCLIVNDITYEKPNSESIARQDNLGFFSVSLRIQQ